MVRSLLEGIESGQFPSRERRERPERLKNRRDPTTGAVLGYTGGVTAGFTVNSRPEAIVAAAAGEACTARGVRVASWGEDRL
jgi:hypothetical protein